MTDHSTRVDADRRSLLKRASMLAGAGVASSLLPRAAWAAEPVVETSNGKIRGATDDGVHVFKGVRYGGDTGGAMRFRPTPRAQKWAGVADATQWGHSAPQDAQSQEPFYAWYTKVESPSEDCLFVNVFTRGLRDNKKRPVMVWYHGGAWGSCAGTAPGFDGTSLARNQDVVVVTVNHRLNAFGYVQLEGNDARFADAGNTGVMDMVASLSWVRENIAQFGGDPRNVTIFGQSGGAAKVIALMGMPAAKGLFHKAIVESCSGGMRITSREEAASQAHDLAGLLGIDRLTGEALQKVPMEALVAAQKKIENPFRPVVDGRSFTGDPFYPQAPAWSAHIPLMIGNANTETSYYIRADKKNFAIDMPTVKRRLKKFLRVDDARVDGLIDAYQTAYPGYDAYGILLMLTTDDLFKRNTLKVASLHAAAGKAPVYAYTFARETAIEDGKIHTPHTHEVPFVFGTTAAAVGQLGGGDDLEPMTKRMQATWASFARNGNPDNPTIPHWAPFRDNGQDNARQTMVLKMQSELARDPGGAARGALEGLPYYEYSISRSEFVKG